MRKIILSILIALAVLLGYAQKVNYTTESNIHYYADAPPLLLITGDRELVMLGRYV